MSYAGLFCRACLQVALVAANVTQIAHGNYGGAFVVGGLISFMWFTNARTAGRSELRGASLVYALGAAVGTVAGMGIGQWL